MATSVVPDVARQVVPLFGLPTDLVVPLDRQLWLASGLAHAVAPLREFLSATEGLRRVPQSVAYRSMMSVAPRLTGTHGAALMDLSRSYHHAPL
jgi:hypothetical protein